MSDLSSIAIVTDIIAGPWGSAFAILAMGVATFLCRIAGALVISRMALTPRMERGLRALPGSVIVATILPVTLDNGPAGIVSLTATAAAMAVTRKELISLAAGLGTLSGLRALGF